MEKFRFLLYLHRTLILCLRASACSVHSGYATDASGAAFGNI